MIVSLALLIMMITYVLANPSDLTTGQSNGVGVYLALLAGLVASVGSMMWIRQAPHSPAHPLNPRFSWGPVIGGSIAVLLIIIGSFSGWSFDERSEVIITPEVQAEIDRLVRLAEEDPRQSTVYAMQISSLEAELSAEKRLITDGWSSEGPGLGVWTLLAGLAGLASILPAAGLRGRNEHQRWCWSSIVAGIGTGIVCVGFGWVLTHVRSADDSYFSGIGSFLAIMGGVFIVATAVPVLKEFRRSKVYADAGVLPEPSSASADSKSVSEGSPVA